MTSPIAFLTVPGPEDNDVADGLKAFNDIADKSEQNFDILNQFAPQLASLYALPAVTVVGSSMFSCAAGWGWTSSFQSRTFARTWLGAVYLYVLVTRTGAAITAGSRGNVGDQDIGYLTAPYKPPVTSYGSCMINGTFNAQCNLGTNGTLRLMGLSYAATIPTGAYLIYQATWPIT